VDAGNHAGPVGPAVKSGRGTWTRAVHSTRESEGAGKE
jgi:hypothetical protein